MKFQDSLWTLPDMISSFILGFNALFLEDYFSKYPLAFQEALQAW